MRSSTSFCAAGSVQWTPSGRSPWSVAIWGLPSTHAARSIKATFGRPVATWRSTSLVARRWASSVDGSALALPVSPQPGLIGAPVTHTTLRPSALSTSVAAASSPASFCW